MSKIVLENVSFSYDKQKRVIDGVSLEINQGEYVAIIGRNGSGKSTLAKLFNALLIPEEGSVVVDGLSTTDKKSLFEIRKRVGVVFQNPDNQLVASIVEDDVAFGPENLGVKRKEIGERIDFALNAVGMQEFRKSSPTRLSGGQKQRIAIAGVLAIKPDVMVFDESTSMLDPRGRSEVLAVMEKLNSENGTTIVTITHFMDEVIKADKVIVMENGRIASVGTPKEIFTDVEKVRAWGLELPTARRIAEKLKSNGVALSDGILSKEELTAELLALKGGVCK